MPFQISEAQIARFHEDGFLFVENLFDAEEMELLLKIGRADSEKTALVRAVKDAQGGESKLWLTAETDREDIYNGFCHGRRLVDTMEKLLGDDGLH